MEESPHLHLHPWKFTKYPIPNPICGGSTWLDAEYLKITYLDSGFKPSFSAVPAVAAMVVPKGRELDPLFSTKEGHHQLMLQYYNLSRLFLVANKVKKGDSSFFEAADIDCADIDNVENYLSDVLLPVHPLACNKPLTTKFLRYQDGLVARHPLFYGSGIQGDFVVVDEEVKLNGKKEFWRRLRFSKSPGRVQCQVRLIVTDRQGDIPIVDLDNTMLATEGLTFKINHFEIVDTTSNAILFGIASVPSCFSSKGRRVLSFGAKAGPAIGSLAEKMGFQVVCVDADAVISAMKVVFEVPDSVTMAHANVFDVIREINDPGAIKTKKFNLIRGQGLLSHRFNVLIVDIPSFEYGTPTGLCMPPRWMITKPVLESLKTVLQEDGVAIIHAVAPDYVFYLDLLRNMMEVFVKVYKVAYHTHQTECLLIGLPHAPPNEDGDSDNDDILKDLLASLKPSFTLEEVPGLDDFLS